MGNTSLIGNCSSIGRVLRYHRRGWEFESPHFPPSGGCRSKEEHGIPIASVGDLNPPSLPYPGYYSSREERFYFIEEVEGSSPSSPHLV